jgi:hypothetical protein
MTKVATDMATFLLKRSTVHFWTTFKDVIRMRRRLADRRARPRFEIVGQMAGTVEATVRVVICDISAEGVLARSSVALAVGSEHRVLVRWDDEDVPATVRVCHVRRDPTTPPGVFLVGFEFVGSSLELRRLVSHCMTSGGSPEPV